MLLRRLTAMRGAALTPATRRCICSSPALLDKSKPGAASVKDGARPAYQPPAPAPPELPASEQREWRDLQRRAEERSQEVYFHPDVRRKPQPDFDGDRNPATGEIGGPKNDPLRHGDYSYNGRVTDF